MTASSIEVTRGGLVESRHLVHVVVVGAGGRTLASSGDAARATFARSAVKMLQALPLVEDGGIERWGLTTCEVAICAASHGGESFHLSAVRSILAKLDLPEAALACGPALPLHLPSADLLRAARASPGRIHNNCSGKHAGMLALARLHGWSIGGYERPDHPVQRRMRATISRWADVCEADLLSAVDGCGIPTFALPLDALARACARFAAEARVADTPAFRIFSAMTQCPEYVAGTGRLCTDLMRATNGRLFAKVGAEGLYCAGSPEMGLGIALKVEDGAWRAGDPALLASLRAVDLVDEATLDRLADHARPEIRNTCGDVVGHVGARIQLEPAGG